MKKKLKKRLIERFDGILTDNGAEVVESKDWGKRRLAYEINDFRDGYYQLIKVNAEPAAVEEFNRLARISEDIIRQIAVKDEK